MKLYNYLISEAIQREDWSAAIAALAAHFNIPMPADYRLDLLRDKDWQHEIRITRGECVCSWQEKCGFEIWNTWSWRPPEDVVVDIYAPLV